MKDMKIGIIGFGNMAQAIVKGWLDSNTVEASQIYVCAAHYDRLCVNAQKMNVNPLKNAAEVVQQCDWIMLAIKPYQIEAVIRPIKELFIGKKVISIAAGWNCERYNELFGEGVHHISTVPNTPIAVKQGILVTEDVSTLTVEEFEQFNRLFEKIAMIEMIDSNHLSIAGTLSGCTPAYTAMYMEALADAGVKHGLKREAAYRMAAKMIVGTGSLYLETKTHPGAMKDAVCSPGGTTIKGVAALESNGFRGAVIKAIDAAEGKE